MGLFPTSFIDDLKSHADIVQVIQERMPLRRSGATWKGLCPFHGEKTPSFHVYGDKGFFKCYGCGVGGDAIRFVELFDKVAFPEAVRLLAARAGLPVPEAEATQQDVESQRERESLLKAHEIATAWFVEQLASPAGATARRQLSERRVSEETIRTLAIGYAPARDGLCERLRKEGFSTALLIKSGLALEREGGSLRDRFRNRLIIPIYRDNGAVVAFGGRAMESGQQPKYLNSPETPVYVKGRTLYGLHLSKAAIAKARYAVMVEGYFDFAQSYQAGVQNVVASSGTALTPAQARLLKRFAAKVVLSFDPDAAGQGAAVRSSELLVGEGFQVNVAMMPGGEDPDTFIRRLGGAAYQQELRQSRPYLEYLLDKTAAEYDFRRDEDRREFLTRMLGVAARIPDAAARDQFADRLAHRARITEEVIRAEIRKAAIHRETAVEARHVPSLGQVKTFERGLIWALVRDPAVGFEAVAELATTDLTGLATAPILEQARSLQGGPTEALPQALLERLSIQEAGLVAEISAQPEPPVRVPADCVAELRRLQLARERADVQRQMDRLLEQGIPSNDERINELGMRQLALKQQIDSIGSGAAPRQHQ